MRFPPHHRDNPHGATPEGSHGLRVLVAKGLMSLGVLYAVVVILHSEEPTRLLAWLPVHALILGALTICGIVIGFWDHRLDTTHASLGALFALVSGFAALAICQGVL